jgi:hypothetical protein
MGARKYFIWVGACGCVWILKISIGGARWCMCVCVLDRRVVREHCPVDGIFVTRVVGGDNFTCMRL